MTEMPELPITDELRIATLRERVISSKSDAHLNQLRQTLLVDARSLRASEREPSWTIRRGLLTRDRLAAMCFEIDDLELLVGRLSQADEPIGDIEAAHAYLAGFGPAHA